MSRHTRRGTVNPTSRPYFRQAEWMWRPIPTSPVLDSNSAAMVTALASGAHTAGLVDYSIGLAGPSGITAATSRYDVTFANQTGNGGGDWGPDPFGSDTMPWPSGLGIPSGTDGHTAVADPINNKVYCLWQSVNGGSTRSASWGAVSALHGDGRETSGSSTGAGMSAWAGAIRLADLAAGYIPHSFAFSTDIARLTTFRYPATKTDGANLAGGSTTIPEGTRVQLDPSVNLAGIPGITAAEITIGKCLQTFGAYCGDNGSSRMAFAFELAPDGGPSGPGATYTGLGLAWDYFDLSHIPWSSLRVLASWDGT